ncbi:serine/threonine protein kinase [Zavarzinella formosa]|uniref:serine/threonine protein kinase n=1 Tax=Zavarzinella formosa TaxID=360055 RepID=UPI0002D2B7B0|nr:serine/threonine-protein kinase [Zavarzinella formosa]
MAIISPIGKYQVLSTLGKGAHSIILHIRRQADSREYALKVVNLDSPEDQKFLDQAKHELRVSQMLGHVNLIKVHALELRRNWMFKVKKAEMLIEYVNGKTMDTVPVGLDRFVPVFGQVVAGLTHMHRRGVFHADLKPNNIMLGKSGGVKIIDYGLAWIKGEKKERVQGTPEYMAPETVKNKIVTERTDIYNLGATMYRVLTLKLPPSQMPSEGDSLRIGSKAFSSMLVPVQDLNKAAPKALADLIHRCLSYDPEKRPMRMGEILDELRRIGANMGTPVTDGEE